MSSNSDLLMLSEIKIDYSFPKGQFQIKGFGDPLGIDRNVNGGGTLFYVREDIPAKLVWNFINRKLFQVTATRLEPTTT